MKTMLIQIVSALLLFKTGFTQTSSAKTEVLLVGVFHFNNPGLDVAKFKVDDMLSPKRQREIEEVRRALIAFRPDAIYTEVNLQENAGWLDSTYQAFRKDQSPLKTKKNELFQLACAVGQRLDMPKLYASDATADFPFDSMMTAIKAAGQTSLENDMSQLMQKIEREMNEKLTNQSIKEILLWLNTPQMRREDLGFYLNTATRAGTLTTDIGATLSGNWLMRNLKIYGNILKQLKGNERRIVVIYGASHCAPLEYYFSMNDGFRVIPLSAVLK